MNRTIGAAGLKAAYAYLNKNPEKNIPKLLRWVDKYDKKNLHLKKRVAVRRAVEEKDNWYRLLLSLWDDIDPGVRKAFFNNFVVNNLVVNWERQINLRKEHGCNIPMALLMDPTSACNLHCTGCWAAEYGHNLSLSLDTLDDIVRQGKELGVRLFLFSGGEPLLRKDDIIRLCEKHGDCLFAAFTNGTLINEAFAAEMLRVKNFIPILSIEGFEEETDARRGAGTYKAVVSAMDLLREKKLLFGASCCYTRRNTETIGSEAFFTELVKLGVKFAWFFTYIPVGADAVPELMVTAEQRAFMYRQIGLFRRSLPLAPLDFWNDGELVNGCIAGGRKYLHINAAGDIEPCAFVHYADRNIRDTSLLDALKSPLFMEYCRNQPFNENLLRPCPLLDNPERLAAMVDASGARSTDFLHAEDVHQLCAKCGDTAASWARTAAGIWREKQGCQSCAACAAPPPKAAGE
ncbi:Radical SAM superfamily enzyme, MoaA/NifB/PqqE/SkfB family [Sporobacter termitidis DSM 10068]|uniref:Radical SAM superfamily enzyme, MoaA/NifB/PqqE/SkfB family n=1 Tax=Sporobacter termitidis DSM 10068 TaxID=1123282 RepID=A0A1M5ZHE1_9FIRM|nr:radical SAM protein [Sporobacter termitidis]SHI23353.1 Radical SAM superfamily enzyme, MoaA/NifB/PqqE/SkfB family [Sporobacter termitidis DSM 10068]